MAVCTGFCSTQTRSEARFDVRFAIYFSERLTFLYLYLALMFFRSMLNMFSNIGFIMLMGLVTRHAIVPVDFTDQTRKEGMERGAALLEAAHVRLLRANLMTTLAMVFGMAPLAFGVAKGSEQRTRWVRRKWLGNDKRRTEEDILPP